MSTRDDDKESTHYETASSQESFSLVEAETASDVIFPPSSNSSTALPISSPPESFNTLDLLDETSATGYSSSDSINENNRAAFEEEYWHDVPTREDVLDFIGFEEALREEVATPFTHTYEATTQYFVSDSLESDSTIRMTRRRSRRKSESHERLTWPLSKDMFVIVVICIIIACISVMAVRPVTMAWVVNEGYYD